ncbi:MAG: IPT/TIG domain-containing protein [bacterium]
MSAKKTAQKTALKSLLLALTLVVLSLFAAAPALWAATTLQSIDPQAHSGGNFYSVKVLGTNYLVGNESGLQVYSNAATPALLGEYPALTASYAGGASGLDIANFKTAVDGATISSVKYAFYADGVNLYVINVNTPATPTLTSSYGIANVRAVTVAQTSNTSKYYLFALAYRPQVNVEGGDPLPPNTLLYIFDVTTPASLTLKATLELDTDSEAPNNTGACDLVYVADVDHDSSDDFDGDGVDYDPYLFIADGVEGLKSVDVTGLENTTPTYPTEDDIYQTDTTGTATGVDVAFFGDTLYACVADGVQGLQVFKVTTPNSLPSTPIGHLASSTDENGNIAVCYDVKLFGGTAFIANGKAGVMVADISDPNTPVDITHGKYSTTALSYIDSTDSYNRLKGTAYGMDFDYSSNLIYPIVAWGEAGLIKTKINLVIIPAGVDDLDGGIVGETLEKAIFDGTYFWVLGDDGAGSDGKLYRITPGAVTATASTNTHFAITANIVAAGDYIYGVATGATTKLARMPKDDLTAAAEATTDTAAAAITNLYTDGESVFYRASGNTVMGRLDVDNFTHATDALIESAAIFDGVQLVIAGSYVYGLKTGTLNEIARISTSFTSGASAAGDTSGTTSANITAIATDPNNTYVAIAEAGTKLARLDISKFGSSGDIVESAAVATASKPIVVLGDYIYGVDGTTDTKLVRLPVDFASGASGSTSSTACAATVASIITDGVNLYAISAADGYVTQYAPSLWGTGQDGLQSAAEVFQDSPAVMVAGDGYILGEDVTTAEDLAMVSFVGDEADHKIATNKASASNFGGYAKDIALYTDESTASDYVFIADGSKGIRRYTLPNATPTDPSTWAEVILTDVDGDGVVATHPDKDLDDAFDIYDARGIDFGFITNFGASVVLVADGTGGVKLVDSGATGLMTDTAVANLDGYIKQHDATAANSLTGNNNTTDGAAAEDIEYFTATSGGVTTPYAAVANGSAGLVILNLDNGANGNGAAPDGNLGDIAVVARVAITDGYAYGVAVDTGNNLVYVAAGTQGVAIVELDPDEDGSFDDAALLDGGTYQYTSTYYGSNHEAYSVTLDDPTDPLYAFVAYGTRGVIILDVSDPTSPVRESIYPSSGQVDGKAYDIAYADNTLYVAMSYGKVLSLDIADPSSISLRESMNTYGEAMGIAFGDLDGGGLKKKNHLFIANGPGGLLASQVKYQMLINSVVTNVQPQSGGDTVKIIGSGFFDSTNIRVYVGSGGAITPTITNAFELTFTAPSNNAGTYDIRVADTSSNLVEDTATSALTYASQGSAIIGLFADTTTEGAVTAPGGRVPLDVVLHNNGAGNLISAKALIKYDKNEIEVLNAAGTANVVGLIDPNTAFVLDSSLTNLTVTTSIIDLNSSDDYLSLMISIYGTAPFSTAPTDKITLGKVYFDIPASLAADQLLILDNTTGQEVSIPNGDVSPAVGSTTSIYVKEAPKLACSYVSETLSAGSSESFGVGPFVVTVSEVLDPTAMVEGAEITFSVSSDALIDADGVTSVFRVNSGALKTGSSLTTSPITVRTNSSGIASVGLNIGTKAGTYTMTISGVTSDGAILSGSPLTKTFTISAETTENDENDSISLSPSTLAPSPGDTVTITITAYDRYGNTMADEDVAISTDQGSLSVTSGKTNSSGQITTDLKLLNSIATHTVTASYDSGQTSETLEVTATGPDVNADGSFTIADIQAGINYHLAWTDLTTVSKPAGKTYVPGDTNHNDRFDLNEVVAIINLAMELGLEVDL